MYDYEFVRLAVKYRGANIDASVYEEVVHERADQGWRLTQILVEFPATVTAEYVLIFERPRPERGGAP